MNLVNGLRQKSVKSLASAKPNLTEKEERQTKESDAKSKETETRVLSTIPRGGML